MQTVFAFLLGTLMFGSLVAALILALLGFGPDSPLPQGVTLGGVALALGTAFLCGLMMWWLRPER